MGGRDQRRVSIQEPSIPPRTASPRLLSSVLTKRRMGSSPGNTDMALPHGAHDRSRGCKSHRLGELTDGQLPQQPSSIKRWDGAARMSYDWDDLRRDPDLWFRNGNCLVHLYGKGQSRRGPAFKVPFSALLASRCRPMIEKFMARDTLESLAGRLPTGAATDVDPVELYIPAPAGSDKTQALLYHLATRNFFAWIFHRSVVGDHLGRALEGLLNSMNEFRSPDVDNICDLLSYLAQEGYLDLRGQPNHALAVLHLAEVFKIKALYIDAFAHCTGMSDRLFLSSEYRCISSVSQKLIRRARANMDTRLSKAGTMLRTFLEDDLSETHLGLTSAARAHLGRFRSFLLSFYRAKLGYYPPSSIDPRSTIFEPEVYRTLAADFQALYEYLVDETFTTAKNSPPLAQGGICTLQSVQSFDMRHKYRSLLHPLPLLPEVTASSTAPRRMSWLGKADKLRPDGRLVAHAALHKATNKSRTELFNNALVCAYRKFEEDSIFAPPKGDRAEKLSQVDARKVRWILVYSAYQTLRSCTQIPQEVHDTRDVPYHLAVSTAGVPPWKEEPSPKPIPQKQANAALPNMPASAPNQSTLSLSMPIQQSIEIKPDVDYFALTHAHELAAPTTGNTRSISNGPPIIPPRSRSITRSTPRSSTLRRSLSLFRGCQTVEPAIAPSRPRQLAFQQIVIHGYGNGTNEVSVSLDDEDVDKLLPPDVAAYRSPSASSNSSVGSMTASSSETKSDSSSPSTPESPGTDYSKPSPPTSFKIPPRGRSLVKYDAVPPERRTTSSSPPVAAGPAPGKNSGSSIYSLDDMGLPKRKGTPSPSPPPAVPARNSARKSQQILGLLDMQPSPLRVRKRATMAEILESAVDDATALHEMQYEAIAEVDVEPQELSSTPVPLAATTPAPAAPGDDDSEDNVARPTWDEIPELDGHSIHPPGLPQPSANSSTTSLGGDDGSVQRDGNTSWLIC